VAGDDRHPSPDGCERRHQGRGATTESWPGAATARATVGETTIASAARPVSTGFRRGGNDREFGGSGPRRPRW
jgi:hypothetical protein